MTLDMDEELPAQSIRAGDIVRSILVPMASCPVRWRPKPGLQNFSGGALRVMSYVTSYKPKSLRANLGVDSISLDRGGWTPQTQAIGNRTPGYGNQTTATPHLVRSANQARVAHGG